MNRNILLIIITIFAGLTAYAQHASLIVDNQTPGWLSSKIEYKDQQTLENLKITGYINGTDIKFIRELNINRVLVSLDLSEAHIVAGGEPYNGKFYTEDNKITSLLFADFNHLEKIVLPISTINIAYNVFSSNEVDTVIVNGTFSDLDLQCFYHVKNIYISEGFTSITADICKDRGYNVETITLPNTLSFIRGNADPNSTTTIISFIQNPQNVQNVEYTQGQSFKDNWKGTIYVPEGSTEKYKKSCFCGMRIVEMIEAKNISISNDTLVLYTNEKRQLTVGFFPEETLDKSVLWHCSDEKIATVDSNGNVIAVSAGKAQIIAETTNGLSDTCDVTVYDHTTGVTMDKTAEININEQLQLTAHTLPLETSDGLVTWSCSNNDIATVTENGIITGVKKGSCIVTATSVDGNYTASCQVKVLQPITDVQLERHDATINVGNIIQINARILPDNADNKDVVWTSSNEDVATVSKDGIITGKGAGTAVITVTSAENENVKDECEVTVLQPVTGIILDYSELVLTNIGETAHLQAMVLPEDASNKEVRWSSSKENVCTVSNNGTIIALDNGISVVTATTVDGGFVAVCTVTVDTTTDISVIETADKDKFAAYYTIDGLRLSSPQKGINIVNMKDGKTKRIIIK